MSGADHLGFIVAAYGATALILMITVIVLVIDGRAQMRLLSRFGHQDRERT